MLKERNVIFALICCLILTSCSCKFPINQKVEGYVYNYETLKPESNVIIEIDFGHQFGGTSHSLESSLSDSLGYFEIPERTKSEFKVPGMESGEKVPLINSPIIMKKDGFIPDTVYLKLSMIKHKDKVYKIDSLFFKQRLK